MAYRFDPAKPLGPEFQRIARELIGLARRQLTETPDRHAGVHEARRAFKKLRGLLRMARPALGEAYETENVRWRDAARQLSSMRDATALIECFDNLDATYAPLLKAGTLAPVRKALVDRRDEMAAHETGLDHRIAMVLEELDRGETAVDALALPGTDPAPYCAGLQHVFGQALKRYRQACRDMTDEGMHDWRKRVKYHWMHLQLLREVWPAPIRERMKAAKRLSDLIGDDHDLVVLRTLVRDEPAMFGAGPEISLLLALVGQRQSELRAEALRGGAYLCDRDPHWFASRIGMLWKDAMEAAPSEPETERSQRSLVMSG